MGTIAAIRPNAASFDLMERTDSGRLRLIEELRAVVDRQLQRRSGGESWSVAFAPDNSYFAWSCGHRMVTLLPWNVDQRECNGGDTPQACDGFQSYCQRHSVVINCGDIVWSLAFGLSKFNHESDDAMVSRHHYYNFSPPGGQTLVLAVGLNSGRIKLYTPSGKLITELVDHRDVVRDLKFSPDGKLTLMSASRDSTVKLWDLKDDGNMFKTIKHVASEWVMCCAWSADAKWAASGGTGKEVYIWKTSAWSLHRKLTWHRHNIATVQFSPDGALLATGSYDTSVVLWDYVNGEIMVVLWHMLPPPRLIFASGDNEHFVRHVSFSPDGEHLASVCDDGYLRIWNIYCSTAPLFETQVQNALCSAYSIDGRYLAVGTRDGAAHLFSAPLLVRPLVCICRSAIRRCVPTDAVDRLSIPGMMKSFLLYKDVASSYTCKRPDSFCGEG